MNFSKIKRKSSNHIKINSSRNIMEKTIKKESKRVKMPQKSGNKISLDNRSDLLY